MDYDRDDERPTRILTSPELLDLQQGATADPALNPWAWVAENRAAAEAADLSAVEVTAVLVAMNAELWLPETLAGLGRLGHRPKRLIAIDNGSTDDTALLLARARDDGTLDAVYKGERQFGFGTAVAAALRADGLDLAHLRATDPAGRGHWLWLLHDDAVPAVDALRQLLSHVATDPGVDLTGPKLLLPARRKVPPQISEVGVSISSTGLRERMVDLGEIDQGQRDAPAERLGLSTCGMLVRAQVWDELGGLDPALPLFRDGVDFGWRARLRGYRVVTTPAARMTHRQVSHAGLRPRGFARRRPGKVDRQLGMLVVAGNATRRALPLTWVRLVLGALLRAVGYLLGKAPQRALDELLAVVGFVAHPGRIRRMRARRTGLPVQPGAREVVRALRPARWSGLRTGLEMASSVFTERYESVAGELETATLDELTGDDFASAADERPRNPWFAPIVVVAAVVLLASFLAARDLFGSGVLAGPALLPAPDGLGEMWRRATDPVVGAPFQSAPPWLLLTALGATVFAGQPDWFVTALVCGVVPLSLVAAYPLVRRVVADRRIRVWTATTYALLPPLLGGSNQGRLSLSVLAIGLPLLVGAVTALVRRRPRTPEAWRGGWASGVVLVVLVAFEPSLMLVAVLAGLVGAVALHRTPRKVGRVGIALAVPGVVLLPWVPSLLSVPGRVLVGPDAALGSIGTAPVVWELLLGRERGPGLPPLWVSLVVFGTIWTVAALGLLRRFDRPPVLAGWVVAVVALAVAVLLSRLVVVIPPTDVEVRPWTGGYLLAAFGALILSGAAGVDGLAGAIRRRSFSVVQPVAATATVAVGLVTLLGATWWVWAGAGGPTQRVGLDAVPPFVRNDMTGSAGARVLAVDLRGSTARYFVLADDQSRLGDADRGYTFGGSVVAPGQAEDLVLRVLAGTADADISTELTGLGVGYLWVTGAGDDETARIDNTPGLGTASETPNGTIWRLQPPVARTVLADGARLTALPRQVTAGDTEVLLPPGSDQRQLRLGEPLDPRWRATLDGQPLTPTSAGWQQAYNLPTSGGRVAVSFRSVMPWVWIASAAVLLLAIVVAAPGIRTPEVRDPAKVARRAAVSGGTVR